MPYPSTVIAIIAVLGLVAPLQADDGAAARGAKELAPFKQQLMGALKAGLAEGPASAIDVCRLEAPAIAERLADDEVRLGRTSDRLRNPDNAGPAWAADVVVVWRAQSGGWTPKVVDLPGGRTGYVEPIVTQSQCLMCHGTILPPGVKAALAEHYPQDQATGFAAGDLRGAFWVSFPHDGDGS